MTDRYVKRDEYDAQGFEIDDSVLTATESEAARVEAQVSKRGIKFFWFLIVLVLIILSARAFQLSVYQGAKYKKIAEGNRIRPLVIKAPRGKIYDRKGKALVHNVPSSDAVIIPADLPENEIERKKIATHLAKYLNMNLREVWPIFEGAKMTSTLPLLVKENLSQNEMLLLVERKKDLSGVRVDKTIIREYTDSIFFSHILGYEGKIKPKELEDNPDYLLTDSIGKQGLEKTYEKYLRGQHGTNYVEVDSLGNIKREVGIQNPRAGSDLILSLDADLQKNVFDIVEETLKETDIKRASVIAMDPRNGEVLALVSYPSFDNNLFARGISGSEYARVLNDPNKPLFNRAIAGEFPPGSTIKPVLAAAALAENVIDENTEIESKGGISVGSFFFGDWNVHGFTNVKEAIAVSSDVFFYTVGGGYGNITGLGIDRIKKYEQMFGFGSPTGIDLTNEASGLVPDEDWKKENFNEPWYIGNTYHASIGQGYMTATPLQLVVALSAVANGGKIFEPRLVLQIKPPERPAVSVQSNQKSEVKIDNDIFKIVKEGMRMTVTEGTAQMLNSLPLEIAGKTGTAQFGNQGKTHGWFTSFAPYDKPEIAVVVLVEAQDEDGYFAVPITKKIYEHYFDISVVEKSEEGVGNIEEDATEN